MENRKRGGRTKGTPNKVTAKIKERLTEVLNAELQKLQLDELQPKDRVELVKALLPYILPRLQTTYVLNEPEQTEIKPIQIQWTQSPPTPSL